MHVKDVLSDHSGENSSHEPKSKLAKGGFYKGLYRGLLLGLLSRGILGVWPIAHVE